VVSGERSLVEGEGLGFLGMVGSVGSLGLLG